jgi:uncharacterized protein with FMN-binding domain
MIPKRAIGALVTTVFALALLLSFKTPDSPGLAASTTSDVAVVGQPQATVAPTTTSAPAAGNGSTTTTSSTYVDGTVTGPVVTNRFGAVQVQVTISGGVIADVTALQLPSGDPHSARISEEAEPLLREEALTAQSADIDLLSGATYTSRAYVQSLQAALDQARA